ncbi:MAG TPA: hypothetical protein VIQ31_35945, partial [Phormidium sp.]
LLINHREQDYRATHENILSIITAYNSKNSRVVESSFKILEYLLSCGILIKDQNDYITFRLNGIFEYFLAFYMKENSSFKDEIASDDNIYMSFKNEFEIYSSLVRNDIQLIELLYNKTVAFIDEIKKPTQPQLTTGEEKAPELTVVSYDTLLEQKIKEVTELSSKIRTVGKKMPLPHEVADEYFDATAPLAIEGTVKRKQIFDINSKSPEIFERYISILARVFRNSDDLKDFKKEYKIFSFILDAYSDFTFYLIESIESERNAKIKDTLEQDDTDTIIYKLVSNFTPTLIQMTMNESLGHFSLEKLITTKIDELKSNSSNNQYQLFLLYFTLLDQDLTGSNTRKLVSELVNMTRLGILKTSIALKLSYYLSFKAYGNPELESAIRELSTSLQLRIHGDRVDLKKLNTSYDKAHKTGIVKSIVQGEKRKKRSKPHKQKRRKKK